MVSAGVDGDRRLALERLHRIARRARFRSRVLRKAVVLSRYRGLTPQDVVLGSYPRSGTTYVRFVLAEIFTGTPSRFGRVRGAFPYVGGHFSAPRLLPDGGKLVYSHELHSGPCRRAIYLIREPRDVAASEYRWLMRRGRTPGPPETFLRDFLKGRSNPWGAGSGTCSTGPKWWSP